MAMVPGLADAAVPHAGGHHRLALLLDAAAWRRRSAASAGAATGTARQARQGRGRPSPALRRGSRPRRKDKLENLLTLDTLQIELGYGLVVLADTRKGGDLLERVTACGATFAQDMGVLIPPIRLRDNLQLGPNEYRFLLKGNAIAQGQLMPGHWLAMNATNSKTALKGMPTVEPVFQLPATWVTDVERKTAEVAGYTVVDAASVLVTHLVRNRSSALPRNPHAAGRPGACWTISSKPTRRSSTN